MIILHLVDGGALATDSVTEDEVVRAWCEHVAGSSMGVKIFRLWANPWADGRTAFPEARHLIPITSITRLTTMEGQG